MPNQLFWRNNNSFYRRIGNCISFFLLSCFFPFYVNAQPNTAGLLNELDSTASDSTKIIICLKLSDNYLYSAPDQSVIHASKAIELIEKNENQINLYAKALNRLGAAYWSKGDVLNAIVALEQSKNLAKEDQNKELVARNLGFIGNVYSMAGDEKNAIESYKEALLNFLLTGNQNRIFAMNNNIAKSYLEVDIIDSARVYFKLAGAAIRKEFEFMRPIYLFNLSELEFKSRNYDLADSLLKVTIKEAEYYSDNRGMVRCNQLSAELRLIQNKPKEALELAMAAYSIALETNVKELITISATTLSHAYAATNNFTKAFEYQRTALIYRDSLNNILIKNQLTLSKQTEEALQFELLKKTNLFNETLALNRYYINLILGGVVILLFIFMFIFIKRKNELDKQRKALAELNEFKDKIFGIISHDIREPLNDVSQVANMLFEKVISPKEISELAPIVNEKISNFQDLMDNLLVWAKSNMDRQKVTLQEFNANEKVNQIIDGIEHLSVKKNIKILNHIDGELVINSDAKLFVIILRNFLINAIKFSDSGSKILIKMKSSFDYHNISVIDEGIGMSESQLQNLFTKESIHGIGTLGEIGSGLGLTLCKDFAETLGGNISAKSHVSEGSTFTLSLPLLITD
jgi:signal transduction histidine kinase